MNPAVKEVILFHLDQTAVSPVNLDISMLTVPQSVVHVLLENINKILDRPDAFHVFQEIIHLVQDPYNVIVALQALTLLQDQLVVLSAQQEAIQSKLEVLNVLIVQLGDLHQELDQQVVNCVLQELILRQQDQPSVLNVMKEVLPTKKVVMSVSLALLELIL